MFFAQKCTSYGYVGSDFQTAWSMTSLEAVRTTDRKQTFKTLVFCTLVFKFWPMVTSGTNNLAMPVIILYLINCEIQIYTVIKNCKKVSYGCRLPVKHNAG